MKNNAWSLAPGAIVINPPELCPFRGNRLYILQVSRFVVKRGQATFLPRTLSLSLSARRRYLVDVLALIAPRNNCSINILLISLLCSIHCSCAAREGLVFPLRSTHTKHDNFHSPPPLLYIRYIYVYTPLYYYYSIPSSSFFYIHYDAITKLLSTIYPNCASNWKCVETISLLSLRGMILSYCITTEYREEYREFRYSLKRYVENFFVDFNKLDKLNNLRILEKFNSEYTVYRK